MKTLRRLDTPARILATTTAALWITAFACVLVRDRPDVGLLLGVIAAANTIMLIARQWMITHDKVFAHGYHAGYHAAVRDQCTYPAQRQCTVLDMGRSEARSR